MKDKEPKFRVRPGLIFCKFILANFSVKVYPYIRTSRISIAMVMLAVFLGCSKNPACWGEDQNRGIITRTLSPTPGCFPQAEGPEFLITSDSVFKQTFDSTCMQSGLDFNTETLLGLYTTGTCEVKYIREVVRDEVKKEYHYKVTVKDCGMCKSMAISYNWAVVPKLPAGWTVTYEIKRK